MGHATPVLAMGWPVLSNLVDLELRWWSGWPEKLKFGEAACLWTAGVKFVHARDAL